MFSILRNSIFAKIFWGFMGLYLLNISVDVADLNPEHIPEDLLFNDQESIIEIIVEKVLGYENAIEEYDDHDREDHNKKVSFKIDIIAQNIIDLTAKKTGIYIEKHKYPDYSAYLTNGFEALDTPPPQIEFVFTT